MSGAMYEQLLRRRATEDASFADSFYGGTIAETASGVADEIQVLLDGWDPSMRIGPAKWMPRVQPYTINVAQGDEATDEFTVAQVVLPSRGDACLVGFDDQHRPWILVWWPA
jgi:hypothetical protein